MAHCNYKKRKHAGSIHHLPARTHMTVVAFLYRVWFPSLYWFSVDSPFYIGQFQKVSWIGHSLFPTLQYEHVRWNKEHPPTPPPPPQRALMGLANGWLSGFTWTCLYSAFDFDGRAGRVHWWWRLKGACVSSLATMLILKIADWLFICADGDWT